MALNLMYITNRPEIAQIAETAGVDRIFIDLEYIGKGERQGGMDTVQSRHTLEDVKRVSEAITTAELLVRVNPIHEATDDYCSSEEEIDTAIKNGADILMLPFFKTLAEAKRFISTVDKRAKTMLLIETPEAVEIIDDILQLDGVDCIHIGLNDLSLGYGKKFMFELLSDGTVERLCAKIREKGIPYGFGGIASLGKGMIPAEMIIKEHYRLGSTCAILSRSFCNVNKITHMGVISSTFVNGIRELREFEAECEKYIGYFMNNKWELDKAIASIADGDTK
ncbi:MAG: aldolase [Clostridia bacterium]|nr:aldolase [Clostridia bacterium]